MSGLGDRWGAEVQLSPQEERAWYDVLGKFKDAASKFEVAYQDLMARPTPTAELANERAQLIARAQTIRSTVTNVRAAMDDVMAALSGAWGQVQGAWDWVSNNLGFQQSSGLNGLGLPIIPIAVVAAAVAAITAFLSDYAKFVRKADAYDSAFKASLSAGRTPEQASAIATQTVNAQSSAGVFDVAASFGRGFEGMAKMLPFVGVAAAVWYFTTRKRRV